jgi:hypothetical protein
VRHHSPVAGEGEEERADEGDEPRRERPHPAAEAQPRAEEERRAEEEGVEDGLLGAVEEREAEDGGRGDEQDCGEPPGCGRCEHGEAGQERKRTDDQHRVAVGEPPGQHGRER